MGIQVCLDTRPDIFVYNYWRLRRARSCTFTIIQYSSLYIHQRILLLNHHEDGGDKILRNVRAYVPAYILPYPRSLQISGFVFFYRLITSDVSIQSVPEYQLIFSSINGHANTKLRRSTCHAVSQYCELCSKHGGSYFEQLCTLST
jgi:hypothetical protein